ncbi:hypothetical protein [Streptomyces sp. CNQ-509]|uniref:hypothetical protein n=1 Tax=Streptomyces sp. CNQ-509 TaxID=444103 RepID=UPI0013DE659C|nr:hypothetical protein [Streptomyces sp. CNQ-509]
MSRYARAVGPGSPGGGRWRGVVVAVVLAVAGVLGAGAGQGGGAAVFGGPSPYGAAFDVVGESAPGADQHLADAPGAGPEDHAAPQQGQRGAPAERPCAPFVAVPRPPYDLPRTPSVPAPAPPDGGTLPGFSPAPGGERAPPPVPGI